MKLTEFHKLIMTTETVALVKRLNSLSTGALLLLKSKIGHLPNCDCCGEALYDDQKDFNAIQNELFGYVHDALLERNYNPRMKV